MIRKSSEFTRQFAEQKRVEHNNNTFTRCPQHISPSSGPTAPPSSSRGIGSPPTSGSSTDSLSPISGAVIGGGIAGGLVGLGLLGAVIWLCYRRRKLEPSRSAGDPYPKYDGPSSTGVEFGNVITPFVVVPNRRQHLRYPLFRLCHSHESLSRRSSKYRQPS